MADLKTLPSLLRPLDVPDFRLRRADTFEASTRDADGKPSLQRSFWERFPPQPPWPAYHPGLVDHAHATRPHENAHDLLQGDAAFVRKVLEHVRAHGEEMRVLWRQAQENEAAQRHADAWVRGEADRLRAFHAKAAAIARDRTGRQTKARRLQLAYFDLVRSAAADNARDEVERTRELTIAAAETRRLLHLWRMSDMWLPSDSGGMMRAVGRGEAPETVRGKLAADDRREVTDLLWEWRRDDRFVTLPNGGLGRAQNGTGEARETAQAKIFLPLLEQRVEAHAHWHATNYFISTPNGSLVRADRQGDQLERAESERFKPLVDERTQRHWQWRRDNLYQSTPNGGFARLADHGRSLEAVSSEAEAPRKEARTDAHQEWHRSHLAGPTPNGGFAPLAGRGRPVEKVSAEHAQTGKDERTERHAEVRAAESYGPTPNHGFARLKDVGRPIEAVGADFAERLKAEAAERGVRRVEARQDGVTLSARIEGLALAAPTGTASNPIHVETLRAAPLAAAPAPPATDTPGVPSRPEDQRVTGRAAGTKRAWLDMQKALAAHETQTSALQQSTARLPEAEPAEPAKAAETAKTVEPAKTAGAGARKAG